MKKVLYPLIVLSVVGVLGFFIDFQLLKADVHELQGDITAVERNTTILCLLASNIPAIEKKDIPRYCGKMK